MPRTLTKLLLSLLAAAPLLDYSGAARRDLLQLAARQDIVVGAAHIAFPGLGRIRQDGASYQWPPLNYDGAPAAN
jgi:hypothetical protein